MNGSAWPGPGTAEPCLLDGRSSIGSIGSDPAERCSITRGSSESSSSKRRRLWALLLRWLGPERGPFPTDTWPVPLQDAPSWLAAELVTRGRLACDSLRDVGLLLSAVSLTGRETAQWDARREPDMDPECLSAPSDTCPWPKDSMAANCFGRRPTSLMPARLALRGRGALPPVLNGKPLSCAAALRWSASPPPLRAVGAGSSARRLPISVDDACTVLRRRLAPPSADLPTTPRRSNELGTGRAYTSWVRSSVMSR